MVLVKAWINCYFFTFSPDFFVFAMQKCTFQQKNAKTFHQMPKGQMTIGQFVLMLQIHEQFLTLVEATDNTPMHIQSNPFSRLTFGQML
jgi:hypothetical protein